MIIYIWHEHDISHYFNLFIIVVLFKNNVCSTKAILWIIVNIIDT